MGLKLLAAALLLSLASWSADAEDFSDFALSPSSFTAFFHRNARPRDWGALARGAQLLLVGESHAMPQIKADLAANMAALKKAGVTHLALEMFGQELQPALSAYDGSRPSAKQREELALAVRQWGWDPAPYLTLLQAARRHGIRLLALNLPDEERLSIVFEPGQTRLNGVQAHMLDKTDRRMAEVLSSALADRKARIVALVGSYHARGLRRIFHRSSRAVLVPDWVLAAYQPADEMERLLIEAQKRRETARTLYLPLPLDRTGYDGAVLLK